MNGKTGGRDKICLSFVYDTVLARKCPKVRGKWCSKSVHLSSISQPLHPRYIYSAAKFPRYLFEYEKLESLFAPSSGTKNEVDALGCMFE